MEGAKGLLYVAARSGLAARTDAPPSVASITPPAGYPVAQRSCGVNLEPPKRRFDAHGFPGGARK